jgi:hypothetical protein
MMKLKHALFGVSAIAAAACAAAPAQALTYVLTPVYPGTISGTTPYAFNETLKYIFTIASPYRFSFTATGSGGTFPFPIGFTAMGGPGSYTQTFGPFPVTGTISYSLTTTIPEPGVWTMLIVGFGLVGISTRRRHSTVAA